MLRRDTRLRQEFLYRKSLDGKRAEEYERRLAIRTAIAEGRPIPTELRQTEAALRAVDAYKDETHDAPLTHIDDEYANATDAPPRIVVTTSRSPSSRLAQFAKELKLMFPNSQRLNRGGLLVSELVSSCRANAFTDLVITHETRGQPDGLVVSHLPYGPTAYFNIRHCIMRHDVNNDGENKVPPVSEAYPHLIFHSFGGTKLGRRTMQILQHLFPHPKAESKRIITFANYDDVISFRHHTYVKRGGGEGGGDKTDKVELTEVGPRFEMTLYQIRLGTADQAEADDEWVLRPYMRTAKQRRVLG